MAVFVFYGYWDRAGCKVFAFSTYSRQVMAVFVLPFRSKNGSYLAILHFQLVFLSLKRKNRFVWPWNELKSRSQRAI